jgi:5-formyltetrahydrofolate cyclo-ligase
MSTLIERKRQIRAMILARLKIESGAPSVGLELRDVFEVWESAQLIMGALLAYVPWGNEVDTKPLIERWWSRQRIVLFPQVGADKETILLLEARGWEDFAPGYAGIMEPIPHRCRQATHKEVGIVLVPGLAFDRNGTRLGRGKGHYDRLLARLPRTAARLGTGHAWQVVEPPVAPLPREPHDVPMTALLTPQGVMGVSDEGA